MNEDLRLHRVTLRKVEVLLEFEFSSISSSARSVEALHMESASSYNSSIAAMEDQIQRIKKPFEREAVRKR